MMQRARGGLLDVGGGFMAYPATRNGVLTPSPVCFQKERWRLIARALNLWVVYGRSVAGNLGIQPPAVSRVACGAPAARKLCLLPASAALCIPCATGLNRGLHDVQ